MKNLMIVVAGAVLAFGAFGEIREAELGQGTMPGTVLQNNHHYTVTANVTIDATAYPGMSALRVPVGASVILEIARRNPGGEGRSGIRTTSRRRGH